MVAAITAGLILLILTVAFGYVAYCGVTGLDPWLPIRGATFTNRLEIWEFVAGEINKRPWFGSGYASLWAIDPAVQPSLKTDQWFGLYVIIDEGHQGFLDLWATTGIIGLGGALILLFNTIVLAGRAIRWTNIAPASWRYNSLSLPTTAFHLAFLVGLILHNFTESNFFCNNGILAFAFVTVMLDLHKWQIAVRKAGHEVVQPHDMLLLPRRVKIRPSRFS
jgi:O-antigen ligase